MWPFSKSAKERVKEFLAASSTLKQEFWNLKTTGKAGDIKALMRKVHSLEEEQFKAIDKETKGALRDECNRIRAIIQEAVAALKRSDVNTAEQAIDRAIGLEVYLQADVERLTK